MTVLAVATVSGLVVEGPMSQPYTTYYLKGCRHSWWMDVTFISNLFFPYLLQMGKTNEGSTVGVSLTLHSQPSLAVCGLASPVVCGLASPAVCDLSSLTLHGQASTQT